MEAEVEEPWLIVMSVRAAPYDSRDEEMLTRGLKALAKEGFLESIA